MPIPFPISEFGGLNLLVDPTGAGVDVAVDLLNIVIDQQGRFRTRDGYTRISSVTGAGTFLVPLTSSSPYRLAAVGPGLLNTYDVGSGTKTAIGTWTAANVTPPTKFGSPTVAENLYIATENNGVGVTLRKWDGTTLGTSSGKPLWVCASPVRGASGLAPRIAQAGYYAAADTPSGANGSQSTVFFSDAGAPDTYTATSWVQISPGDGESFTGMVAYGGSLWLTRNTSAFEFYGEGTDSSGNPVFSYRRVPLRDPIPVQSNPTAWQPVAAGPDGVYYAGTMGLWRITGSGVSRVPTPIDGILAGTDTSALANNGAAFKLGWAGSTLYILYTNSLLGQNVLQWDTHLDVWTAHSYADALMSAPVFAPGFNSLLWFADNSGNLNRTNPSGSSDNGSSINWRYQTGYSNAGGYFRARIISSAERKRHHHVDILGSGTVTHQVLALNGRPNDVADPGGSVTLGTAPALARGWRGRATRGTHFAQKLSGSGPAVISSLTYWLANVEQDT